MNKDDFNYIRQYIKKETAINLSEAKEYFIESHLNLLAEATGYSNSSDLISALKKELQGELHKKIIDALTNNETSFFRDMPMFKLLQDTVLPDMINKRKHIKKLYIWFAACSSGQEPYSVIIFLKEHFPILHDWKFMIVASDISEHILSRAEAGIFSQFEISRGLPTNNLIKYFKKISNEWAISDNIKSMISFRKINLNDEWALPVMDLIFMRNVLIYVDGDSKIDILNRAANSLAQDGYFFLGSSEILPSESREWITVSTDGKSIYYIKNPIKK